MEGSAGEGMAGTGAAEIPPRPSEMKMEKKKKKKEKAAATAEDGRKHDNVWQYPYAPDEPDGSLSRLPVHLMRRIPHREQVLEANGARCEFELNLDVKMTEWNLGEWRAMALRQASEVNELVPVLEEHKKEKRKKKKTKGWSEAEDTKEEASSLPLSLRRKVRDEALVIGLAGTAVSPNCDFRASINVTAVRTDWEHTTGKAINYSFYMMLACITQIVVLLRQLLHTQAQSTAVRVSLICIGWQTVLDAMLCIGHIFLCLVMQPLFTAFASVAFFKLLIFCVIEMKYMAIIMQARHNAARDNGDSGNYTAEELRRKVALLHIRFYVGLMFAFSAFWFLGLAHRLLYLLALYSFWIPQIARNVVTEARKPLHPYYIYGMSVTRLAAPLYVFGV